MTRIEETWKSSTLASFSLKRPRILKTWSFFDSKFRILIKWVVILSCLHYIGLSANSPALIRLITFGVAPKTFCYSNNKTTVVTTVRSRFHLLKFLTSTTITLLARPDVDFIINSFTVCAILIAGSMPYWTLFCQGGLFLHSTLPLRALRSSSLVAISARFILEGGRFYFASLFSFFDPIYQVCQETLLILEHGLSTSKG